MSATTLSVDGIVTISSALLYAFVGVLMLRRPAKDADARLALALFAVWWFGLGAFAALDGTRSLLAAAGILDLGPHLAIAIGTTIALVAALWGLVYYLLYVYLGRRWVLVPVTLFHIALVVGVLYLVVSLGPSGVEVSDWAASIAYAEEAGGALTTGVTVAILGPALLAAFGYGSLYFQTEDRTARYRVAMVAGAFLLWFGASALATPMGISSWYWWPLVAHMIGIVATLMVIAAYLPPRALARAFGLRAVTEAAPTSARDAPRGPRLQVPHALIGAALRTPCA